MKIIEEECGGILVVVPYGRLDTVGAKPLENHLISTVNGSDSPDLIVDCSALDYISSAGLRAFVVAGKAAKAAGGKIVLCRMSDSVRYVFDTSGFSLAFAIFTTRELAAEAFAA